MIILQPLHERFEQCLLKLQSQVLSTELTSLKPIPSILIRQKYFTAHFHFANKLLIKQKSLIMKFSYILFHDEIFLFK